jgi:hypothetical protein
MNKYSTAASIIDINGSKRRDLFGSALLFLTIACLLFLGVVALLDAATLYRARTWPVVEAHLDRCDMTLHATKSAYYWHISAAWSYGSHGEHRYSDEWAPSGAPEYARSDPKSESSSERAAVTARYCNETAIGKLRVSPGGTIRPDEEVMGANPLKDACIAILLLLIGCGVMARLFYDRSQKSRRNARA